MARKQKEQPFHAPFAGLKERLARSSSAAEPAGARPVATVAPGPRRDEPEPGAPCAPCAPRSDAELWADAVAGVAPLSPGPGVADPPPPRTASEPFWHPDLDAIRALEALVSGDAPFDLADTDEFIEGRVPGLDPGVVRRLRRGEFAVQGHVDLHGLTREEAKLEVDRFLKKSRQSGKRCVLLVHGRGIHSKDQVPVLKEALRSWLATARFGRHVLAFATARPADGGAGAVYVLLRRAGK